VVSAAYDTDEGIATATSRRSGKRARKFFKKCITLFRFQVYKEQKEEINRLRLNGKCITRDEALQTVYRKEMFFGTVL